MAACLAADAPTAPLITQDDDDDGHLPINKNQKKNCFLKIDLLRLLIFPFLFFSFLFFFYKQLTMINTMGTTLNLVSLRFVS